MKNKLFLFLALIGMMLPQIVSAAERFEVNGIYYYASGNNAEVVQAGGRIYYSGDVVIPSTVNYNGNTYNVTSISSYAFLECSNLTSVIIPESVTSIGYSAFSGCSSLTSINIPSSVMSIEDGAFNRCTSLPVTNNIRYADCYAIEAVDKSLASYTFKEGTRFIGSSAFYDCSNLTSITIPNGVTSIGGDAFSKCSNLTSITIPNSVTSIGRYAFKDCTGLNSVTIPNSVTSIGEYAFSRCSSLPVTNNIRYADCYAIEAVDKSLASYTFKEGTRFIGSSAFYDCSNLTSITIPNGVTSIGGDAFSKCSNLTSITIPNSVTSIGRAFKDCTGLTSVTIGNGVTSIGDYGFSGCSGLTYVTIGENVRNIEGGAFYGCPNIETITSYAVIPPMCKEYTFDSELFNKTKVYVPNAENALARYLGNNVWGQFRYIYEKDLTGVDTPVMNGETQVSSLINLNGQYITNAQRGINLQKMSNGTTKKVLMR